MSVVILAVLTGSYRQKNMFAKPVRNMIQHVNKNWKWLWVSWQLLGENCRAVHGKAIECFKLEGRSGIESASAPYLNSIDVESHISINILFQVLKNISFSGSLRLDNLTPKGKRTDIGKLGERLSARGSDLNVPYAIRGPWLNPVK